MLLPRFRCVLITAQLCSDLQHKQSEQSRVIKLYESSSWLQRSAGRLEARAEHDTEHFLMTVTVFKLVVVLLLLCVSANCLFFFLLED